MHTNHRKIGGAALLVALSLAAVALAGSDDADTGHGDDPPPVALVDWTERTVDIDDDRWTVAFCDGDAPFLCLTDRSGSAGVVELTSWPVDTLDATSEVLARGGTHAEALRAFEAEFVSVFVEDRAEGCGAGYDVVPDEPTAVTVAGRQGLRYGFRGVVGGVTVEHVVGHAVIAGDHLHLLGASGLAEDGCLGRESEFAMAAFDEATVALLGRIAAASRLPDLPSDTYLSGPGSPAGARASR